MSGIDDMLNGVDQKTLENGMRSAKQFANTPEGKAMIQKFKGQMPTDKDSLMKLLSDNPEFIKHIEKFLNL